MSSVRRPRISKPKLPKIKKPNLSRSKGLGKKRPALAIKGARGKIPTNSINKKNTRQKAHNSSSKNVGDSESQLDKIKKEIQSKKLKQSKIINQIKDDLKKIRENNISISGLEQISPTSIKRLQENRTKSVSRLTSTVNELNFVIKNITRLETKYNQRSLKK